MAFNEAQKQAILHKEGPMLVLAGARFRKDYGDYQQDSLPHQV